MGRNRKVSNQPATSSPHAEVQRWAVLGAVVAVPFVVGPPDGIDGLMAGKAAVVVAAAIVALGAWAMAAARQARIDVARDPALVAAGGFLAVFLVATAFSPSPPLAISGDLPRWNGLAMYLACAVLFVVAASRFTFETVPVAIRAMVVAGGLLAAVALAEALRVHEFGGAAVTGARATLGNPNFLAAWLAVAVPLCIGLALDARESEMWRRVAVGAALAAGAGTVASVSLQGPAAAVIGASVVGLVWMSGRFPAGHVRATAAAVLALGGGAVIVLVLGVQGTGPAAQLADQAGVEHRGYYWQAAVEMVGDEPLLGKGPGHFEQHYRIHRPVEDALASPLEDSADAAHSVPLDMAAAGGVPLFLAYVAWITLVGWRLWRGLTRLEGRERLHLGAIGGAWLAYVAQSLVSIDVPPLAVFGWVLGGLVIALASGGRMWELRLPWAPQATGRRSAVPAPVRVVDGFALVVGVVLLWFVLLPLRADAGAIRGELTPAGDIDPRSGVAQAARLADWEPAFGMQLVEAHMVTGDQEGAQDAAVELATRIPGSFDASLTAARLAAQNGDANTAARMYRHVLRLEPHHPDVALEAARFARQSGDVEWARSLVERVLDDVPGHRGAVALSTGL